MDAIPASVWMQYPVALILLVAVFVMLREFKAFLEKQNLGWQNFLKDQKEDDKKNHADDQVAIRELVGQVKNLAQELVNLRADFDKAVAIMQERTAPKPKPPYRKE